jgi:hypothetical protein
LRDLVELGASTAVPGAFRRLQLDFRACGKPGLLEVEGGLVRIMARCGIFVL